MLRVTQNLACLYREHDTIPTEDRPRTGLLMDCFTSEWIHKAVTDQDIEDIVLRWQQMRHLRDLYLDDHISSEFNRFRTEFISTQAFETRAAIVKPGITTTSILPDRVRESRKYGYDFRARFYKALVLHSMAVAASRLGRVALSPHASYMEYRLFIGHALKLWRKTSVTIGGTKIALSLTDRLDGLEIYDFLYVFLLRKIIPHNQLGSWKDFGPRTWLYNGEDLLGHLHGRTYEWYHLLLEGRRVLMPQDLVDLVYKRAWTAEATFPPEDRAMYMRVRGMFDTDVDTDMHWQSCHVRYVMVQALHPESLVENVEPEEPCWWDHARLSSGSPFLPGATSSFHAGIPRIDVENLTERSLGLERRGLSSAETEEPNTTERDGLPGVGPGGFGTTERDNLTLARDSLLKTLKEEVVRVERLVKQELVRVGGDA